MKSPHNHLKLLLTSQPIEAYCVATHAYRKIWVLFWMLHCILKHFPIHTVYIYMSPPFLKVTVQDAHKISNPYKFSGCQFFMFRFLKKLKVHNRFPVFLVYRNGRFIERDPVAEIASHVTDP
jgi:hypothetical protein